MSSRELAKSAKVVDIRISDHSAINLYLCWNKLKPSSNLVMHRSFRIFDSDKFKQDLSEVPWSVLEMLDKTDDKVDKHAPLQKVCVKKNGSPWVTRATQDLMDSINKLL